MVLATSLASFVSLHDLQRSVNIIKRQNQSIAIEFAIELPIDCGVRLLRPIDPGVGPSFDLCCQTMCCDLPVRLVDQSLTGRGSLGRAGLVLAWVGKHKPVPIGGNRSNRIHKGIRGPIGSNRQFNRQFNRQLNRQFNRQ